MRDKSNILRYISCSKLDRGSNFVSRENKSNFTHLKEKRVLFFVVDLALLQHASIKKEAELQQNVHKILSYVSFFQPITR